MIVTSVFIKVTPLSNTSTMWECNKESTWKRASIQLFWCPDLGIQPAELWRIFVVSKLLSGRYFAIPAQTNISFYDRSNANPSVRESF